MIRARIEDGRIVAQADADGAAIMIKMPGATRSARMPPGTWSMALSGENIDALRAVGARASPELVAEAKRIMTTRRYIEQQKVATHVEPMKPMPLKPDVVPFQHQSRAYNIVLALLCGVPEGRPMSSGCALYLDMGLGKTLTAIAVMGRLFLDGKIHRVLVVAPTSVCAVWPHELKKYAGYPYRVATLLGTRDKRETMLKQLRASDETALQLTVINYESVRLFEAELKAFAPELILADESQRIKNHAAKQSKAMHRLGDQAKYKMILTGTPVTQDTRDVWSQYRFLDPEIFGRSYYAFEKRYALMGGYGQHQYLGPRNLDELTRKAHSIAYRATKAECLDLPDKLFEERIVELEPSVRALYRRIQKESYAELASGGEVTASIVLTRLLRLQQLTGGFLTDDDGKVHKESDAKLNVTRDIVQSVCVDEGRKLVIFARFRAEIVALREAVEAVLHPDNLKHVAIWGDIPPTKRGQIVEQFQTDSDVRVLVGQIEACAEGITLTAAHTTLYYSLTWNLAKYLQSQDRTHRIGQDHGTLYIHLVAPGTIDTKIMGALKKKEELAHSVVDNWRALLTEEEGDR